MPGYDYSAKPSKPEHKQSNSIKPPSAISKNPKELKTYVVTGIYDKYIPQGVSLKVWHKACAAYLNFPFQKKEDNIEDRIMMTKGVDEDNFEMIMEALVKIFGEAHKIK